MHLFSPRSTMTRMRKPPYFLASFAIFFFLGILLFFLLRLPIFSPLRAVLEQSVLPIERMLYAKKIGETRDLEKLRQENVALQAQLAKQ